MRKLVSAAAKTTIAAALLVLLSSCSVDRLAVRMAADALSSGGDSTVIMGDDDPELVGDAIPFTLKMYESLLAEVPDHRGLALSTGSTFVMYANAFVQGPAEMLPPAQFKEQKEQLIRAKRLYLRGLAILDDAQERAYPGYGAAFRSGTLGPILAKMKKKDVPFLYWSAAAYLAAFSVDPLDLERGVHLSSAGALMARAYELDPDFQEGGIDDFYISYYASLPSGLGGDRNLALRHYELALQKSKGALAGPYVSYAQAICVADQDYRGFKDALDKALAIDAEADAAHRLVNVISQRKARYLLDHAEDLFLVTDEDGNDNLTGE